ncbi:MAG TPA: hypothetical protein VGL93_10645 [Streptosporangiaceae bacterium]|jgi:hypothetical protein
MTIDQEIENDRAYQAGIAADLARMTEYAAEIRGALREARRLAGDMATRYGNGIDGEPSGEDLADLAVELDDADRHVRAAERIIVLCANTNDDFRAQLDAAAEEERGTFTDPDYERDAVGPVEVRITVEPSTGDLYEEVVTIPADEWNAMRPAARTTYVIDMAVDAQNNEAPCGATVIGGLAEPVDQETAAT